MFRRFFHQIINFVILTALGREYINKTTGEHVHKRNASMCGKENEVALGINFLDGNEDIF